MASRSTVIASLILVFAIYAGADWLRERLNADWPRFFLLVGLVIAAVVVARALVKRAFDGRDNAQTGQTTTDLPATTAEEVAEIEDMGAKLEAGGLWRASVPREPLLLRYRDGSKKITERTIYPKTIHGTRSRDRRVRPEMVIAYCMLRRDIRSFWLERIEMAANAETGEVIEDLYTYLGSAQDGGAPPQLTPRRRTLPK